METTQQGSSNGVRRLTRRTDDKIIAGVAGGLADYTGLDPVIFRIAFIVLAFLGGVGIAAYGAGWLLIPKAGARGAPGDAALGRMKNLPAWVGIALLVIAAALVIDAFTWGDPAIVWAIVLVAIGVVLLRDEPRDDSIPPPPVPPAAPPPPGGTAPVEGESTGIGPMEAAGGGGAAAAPPVAKTSPMPRMRRRREPSSLGWFTIAAVLMAVGFGAVLENWDVLSLDVGQFFALALTITGAGLVVGALWGRSRLMVVFGLALIPMVLASSLIDMPLRGRVGDTYLTPRSIADLEHYELLAGQMTIDLTQLRWDDDEVRIEGEVAMGELEVIIPRGVRVEANGQIELGELDLFNHYDDGADLQAAITVGPEDAERTVILDLEGGIGSIQAFWSYDFRPPKPAQPQAPREPEAPAEPARGGESSGGGNERRQGE